MANFEFANFNALKEQLRVSFSHKLILVCKGAGGGEGRNVEKSKPSMRGLGKEGGRGRGRGDGVSSKNSGHRKLKYSFFNVNLMKIMTIKN